MHGSIDLIQNGEETLKTLPRRKLSFYMPKIRTFVSIAAEQHPLDTDDKEIENRLDHSPNGVSDSASLLFALKKTRDEDACADPLLDESTRLQTDRQTLREKDND